MCTISALKVEGGGFAAEGARTDDDAGDAHEVGHVGGGEAADTGVGDA